MKSSIPSLKRTRTSMAWIEKFVDDNGFLIAKYKNRGKVYMTISNRENSNMKGRKQLKNV